MSASQLARAVSAGIVDPASAVDIVRYVGRIVGSDSVTAALGELLRGADAVRGTADDVLTPSAWATLEVVVEHALAPAILNPEAAPARAGRWCCFPR